jgi:hypothetical protein
VPLSRVCQFLRQAGLLPRVLSKLITELQQVGATTAGGWSFMLSQFTTGLTMLKVSRNVWSKLAWL